MCFIDVSPVGDQCIDGIVYCHYMVEHTPSIGKTVHPLYALMASCGEFVFNCYPFNAEGLVRWMRFHSIYQPLCAVLSRMPLGIIIACAVMMAALSLVTVLGCLFEKLVFCGQCSVPRIVEEKAWQYLKRRLKNTSANSFDGYGSHSFQHNMSDEDIRALVVAMRPDATKLRNILSYFLRPAPMGCALRVWR